MIASRFFTLEELRCPCCKRRFFDYGLLSYLNVIRYEFNRPIKPTSACRCVEYNKRIGGVPDSRHTHGLAVDIQPLRDSFDWRFDEELERLRVIVELVMPEKSGIIFYENFIHLDLRPIKYREDKTGLKRMRNV